MMLRPTFIRIATGLMLLLCASCASNLTARRTATVSPSPHPPWVAVLPFDNVSGKQQASAKITEIFQSLLTTQSNLETLTYGETYDMLRQLRIRSTMMITAQQIDTLAKALHVDYLVTGSVLEFDEFDNTYLGKVPQVSFNTRVIDCQTGKTVWVGVSNGSGDKGELLFGLGAVRSADQLAVSLVKEAVEKIGDLFPGK